MSEQKQNEIEYIEPTQDHVGQMVEVSDNGGAWHLEKLLGIIDAKERFVTSDGITVGWKYARIHCPKPQAIQEQPTKPIDWTKPVRTKDGRPVRVLCTDGPGDYPVVGFVDKCPAAQQWTLAGAWEKGSTHEKDLENAPQCIQREYWVNVYPDTSAWCAYKTRNDADDAADINRFACVKITIDCEEGEGL